MDCHSMYSMNDAQSHFTRQTGDNFSVRTDYNINNKDVKGLKLKKVSREDQLSLKLIYLLDAKRINGYLILSERKISLGQTLDKLNVKHDITMEQKKRKQGEDLLSICHFKIMFKYFDLSNRPKSVNQFMKLKLAQPMAPSMPLTP